MVASRAGWPVVVVGEVLAEMGRDELEWANSAMSEVTKSWAAAATAATAVMLERAAVMERVATVEEVETMAALTAG